MKTDINKLYGVIENSIHQITGSKPYATDKNLGLDSLDFVDISNAIDLYVGVATPMEWYRKIPNDSSLLEIVTFIHQKLRHYDPT